jgi:N-acetylmuramoyl-L-alanine amidase
MIKKLLFLVMFTSLLPVLFSFSSFRNNQKILKTIIIDAGHGIMANGKHNGAKGSYSYEDDICLAIAKKLVAMFRDQLPDVKIIETRPDENIVDLHRRAEIANQNKGDLFISIHANAMPPIKHSERVGTRTEVYYSGHGKKKKKHTRHVPVYHYWTTPNPRKGTETYIWGAHKNEDKEVAVRENAPMLEEDNYKEMYGDIDPNSPEFIALSLLKTKQFFKRSASLAGFVEDEFYKIGRTSRGQQQRQVGIWVLQATAMPSVLVETGYITNKEEEDYLNSQSGQEKIAQSIVNAVKTYIGWLQKNQVNTETNNQSGGTKVPVTNSPKAFLQMIEQKEKTNRVK